MQGLSEKASVLFIPVSKLECIRDYSLIGGTALALQIGHRLSEDLDFCKWPLPLKGDVDWPQIEKELKSICNSVKVDVLDFNQVNFLADSVKFSFYSNQIRKAPTMPAKQFTNNLKVEDITTIGSLKLEVMLRRSAFRDYYDLYSILKEGISLKLLVDKALKYSNNILSTKSILNFISNNNNFRKEVNFELLKPKYQVSGADIETFVKTILKKEYA